MTAIARIDSPEQWAVLDGRGVPISNVTRFLRHLHSIERSSNTIKAYASDLSLFFSFLEQRELVWTAVNNEVLGQFVRFARTPTPELVRKSNLEGKRSTSTVNRYISAVSAFAKYLYGSSNDQVYPTLLRTSSVRSAYFTEHRSGLIAVGPRLREVAPELVLLTADQIDSIVNACNNLRDKLIVSMLRETGMRIGQLLLLRHSDVRVPTSIIRVQKHDLINDVEARNKSVNFADVPVSRGLIRLYAAYMSVEYRMIDSDFVFVNLWAGDVGQPMTYHAIEQLIMRLRKKSGAARWSAHTFRHSFVTDLINKGVAMKTVSYLVTHGSVATTMDIYDHVDVEDVRRQLTEAGVLG